MIVMSTKVVSVPEISGEAPRPQSKVCSAPSTEPFERWSAALSCHLITAIVVLIGAAILLASAAAADPNQDDRFLALLDEQGIPAIKNTPTLIAVAHRVCRELDGGMRVDAVTDELTEKAYNAYPPERLFPPDRVARTQTRFIIAAVLAYCPNDQSKIASIMANPVSGSNQPTHPVAAYAHNAANSGSDSGKPPSALDMINMAATWQTPTGAAGLRLPQLMNGGVWVAARYGHARPYRDTHGGMPASLIRAVPAGEIAPNPPQIPAPPPSAQIEIPPPPIAAPPAPQQPPPAPQQQVEPPAAPQPGGAAGSGGSGSSGGTGGDGTGGDGTGGNGVGGPEERPMPPGFVRLAP